MIVSIRRRDASDRDRHCHGPRASRLFKDDSTVTGPSEAQAGTRPGPSRSQDHSDSLRLFESGRPESALNQKIRPGRLTPRESVPCQNLNLTREIRFKAQRPGTGRIVEVESDDLKPPRPSSAEAGGSECCQY